MAKTASDIVDRALSLIDEVPTTFATAATTETSIRQQAFDILPEVCRDLIKELPWELKRYLAQNVDTLLYSDYSYNVPLSSPSFLGIAINNSKLYLPDPTTNAIHRFTIAGDSSLSYDNYSYPFSVAVSSSTDLTVYNGKLYLGDNGNDVIQRYTINPDDSLTYDSYSYDLTADGIELNVGIAAYNGKLWVDGYETVGGYKKLYRYDLDGSGNITNDAYSFLISDQSQNTNGLSAYQDKLFVGRNTPDKSIIRYSIDNNNELSLDIDYKIDVSSNVTALVSMDHNGDKLYVGSSNGTIFLYDILINSLLPDLLANGEDQSGYFKQKVAFKAPSDFWELVSLRMTVWAKPVTEYILIGDENYPKQNNPFTRAGKQNPVVAISNTTAGVGSRIECFSIDKGDANTVSIFNYVSFNNVPDDIGNSWPDELFDEVTKALATQLHIIKARLEEAEVKGIEIDSAIEQHE